MGTDIHFYVERRAEGRWISCDQWEKDEYEPERVTVPDGKHFFDARSYDTFAMLANIRNGSGFAGVDTGDGFVPIAEPRGLPDDLSPQLASEAEGVDHTPTWLTLKELMEYDWTRTTTKRGWVNGVEYDNWSHERARGNGPDTYSGGVSGGVLHVSDAEMGAAIKRLKDRFKDWQRSRSAIEAELGSTYCQVSWTTPYYKSARTFLSEVMPRLWRLGAPEDVRIVFWFDS